MTSISPGRSPGKGAVTDSFRPEGLQFGQRCQIPLPHLLDIAEKRRRLAKEDAAFATKTGQWASGYKYTMIESLIPPEGVPGGYEQVLVDFVKPRRVRQPRKQK